MKTLLELHTSAKHYILFAYTHCLYNITKGFEIMAFIFSLFYFIFPHGFIVCFFFLTECGILNIEKILSKII